MPKYDLKGMQASSIYQLGELAGNVHLPDDWNEFRSVAREICDHFLTLATASLLADMKVDFFFQNLCRSADNWRRFVVSSQAHYRRQVTLTYHAPIHAAIITGEKALIHEIAQVLPKDYLKGEEYEDQFLKCKIFVLLAAGNCQLDEEIEKHLARLEELAAEPLDATLFKALLGLDELTEEDFWSNFETALYRYDEYVETKIKSVTTKISQFIAHKFIWFEGLAWLRLALVRGYTLPSRSILYCPDEALEEMPAPFLGDWPLIPLAS